MPKGGGGGQNTKNKLTFFNEIYPFLMQICQFRCLSYKVVHSHKWSHIVIHSHTKSYTVRHRHIIYSHTNFATLGLHLGFSAKLKILQVSACKMEPRSGYIILLYSGDHPSVGNQNLVCLSFCPVRPPNSVSVLGTKMSVSLSVRCPSPPPKNLASSSLQDGFDLAHSTWILSVALPA